MRRLVPIIVLLFAAPALQGCLAAAAVGAAGAVVGTTAKVAVKTTGAVVGAVIPDGDKDKKKELADDRR